MEDGAHGPQNEIVSHLRALLGEMSRQSSIWYALRNGVFYGVGFIIGSTVLTALVVSVTLQFFGGTVFGDVIAWIAAR